MEVKESGSKWRTDDEKRALIEAQDKAVEGGMSKTQFAMENKLGLTDIIRWRRKFEGKTPVAREVVERSGGKEDLLKQARIENHRLRIIISDLLLDKQALMEYNERRQA